jgi:hypothetical protein
VSEQLICLLRAVLEIEEDAVHVLNKSLDLDGASISSLQLICLLRAGGRGRLAGGDDGCPEAIARGWSRRPLFLLGEVNQAIPLPGPILLYIFFLC